MCLTRRRDGRRGLRGLAAALAVALGFGAFPVRAAEAGTASIALVRPPAGTQAEFQRDVVPILRANCLPCHNKTSAKADLLLESVADMLKGGESGPAIVLGKPAESLLLRVSTHEVKPRMPPKENKANARALTPEELGLLSAWIEQGARSSGRANEAIAWQPLAASVQNIAAAAITADGRLAAAGRGNELVVYDLGLGVPVARLVDPTVGTAHRDTVNAVALSPDGEWLASGGFREVKLWQRRIPTAGASSPAPVGAPTVLTNAEFSCRVSLGGTEPARLLELKGTNVLAQLELDRVVEFAAATAVRRTNQTEGQWAAARTARETALKDLPLAVERRGKAITALAVAGTNVAEKRVAFERATGERTRMELALLRAERTGDTNQIKAAGEKRDAATKALEGPEREWKQTTTKEGSAEEELRLAALGLTRATLAVSGADRRWADAAADRQTAVEACAQALTAAQRVATNSQVTAAWFAEGQLITAHRDGSRRTWNPRTGAALDVFRGLAPGSEAPFTRPQWRLVRTLGNETNSPFADRINALAFRPDGARLAIGGGDPSRGGDVHVLEPIRGDIRYAFTNLHSDSVLALAWSPDGRWLATGGADRLARLLDTASAQFERVFEGHTAHVLAVGWSPDGRLLATGGADSAIKFWEPFTGEKRKSASGSGKEITGVAFVSADQVVGATGDPAVAVWKVGGDKVRDYEKPADYQQALAVTPDGQTLVAGGLDGILRVWRGTEPKPVWSLGPPTKEPAVGTAAQR